MQELIEKHMKINVDYNLEILEELINSAKDIILLPDYFTTVQQNLISPTQRAQLVEWMIEISDEIKLNSITKQTAILIVDLIMSRIQIPRACLQLLAITSLMICIKQEESFRFNLTDAVAFCANAYSVSQVAKMEISLLKTLGWKTLYPTPGDIARRLLLFTNVLSGHSMPTAFKQIDNYIDLCLYDFELNVYGPLIIGVASIFCVLEQFKLFEEAMLFKRQIEHLFKLDSVKIIECFQVIFRKISNVEPQTFHDHSAELTASTNFTANTPSNFPELLSPYTPASLTANDSMETSYSQNSLNSSQSTIDLSQNVLQSLNNSYLVTPEKFKSEKKYQTPHNNCMQEEMNQ